MSELYTQPVSLFENALKFYIQKEKACGFSEFFHHTLLSSQEFDIQYKSSEDRKRKQKRSPSTDIFSFAVSDNQSSIATRKSSNPHLNLKVSSMQHSSEKIQQNRIPKRNWEKINQRKEEQQQSQQRNKDPINQTSELSPERLNMTNEDDNEYSLNRIQSPYDKQWIEKILKQNYQMQILCENEHNHEHYGVKPKLKTFRISKSNSNNILQNSNQDLESQKRNNKYTKTEEQTKNNFDNLSNLDKGNSPIRISKAVQNNLTSIN